MPYVAQAALIPLLAGWSNSPPPSPSYNRGSALRSNVAGALVVFWSEYMLRNIFTYERGQSRIEVAAVLLFFLAVLACLLLSIWGYHWDQQNFR
jgi:hypothetical protein